MWYFVMYCMQCCMFVSAVLNVCSCDMFSVVNVYLNI